MSLKNSLVHVTFEISLEIMILPTVVLLVDVSSEAWKVQFTRYDISLRLSSWCMWLTSGQAYSGWGRSECWIVRIWTEINLNKFEMDLNECEHSFKTSLDRDRSKLNRSYFPIWLPLWTRNYVERNLNRIFRLSSGMGCSHIANNQYIVRYNCWFLRLYICIYQI